MNIVMARTISIAILLSVLPAAFGAIPGALFGSGDQIPLLSNAELHDNRSISVGFSLESSYAAVGIIFHGPDGERETVTRTIYGDNYYQQVMARLSLPSSRHIAPPYEDDEEYYIDIPRKTMRSLNKKLGLPASPDVGVLAKAISQLRYQVESEMGIRIVDATVAVPHLLALYQDDIADACEHVGIAYIEHKDLFRPLFWQTSAAFAGYGFGLCKHYMDEPTCDKENDEFPRLSLFAVHYSRTALTTTLAEISEAQNPWDPDYRRTENFTLGNNAISRYETEEEYWSDVRGELLKIMIENPLYDVPKMIILTGDMVHGTFMRKLEETMRAHIGTVPPIWSEDAMVVTAKGAAELRRRTPPYVGTE